MAVKYTPDILLKIAKLRAIGLTWAVIGQRFGFKVNSGPAMAKRIRELAKNGFKEGVE